MAESELLRRAHELEKRLGKGQTFSAQDCNRILEGVVPLRVLLGARVLKGEAQKTYRRAYERLIELEKEHGPAIDMAAYGSGGASSGRDTP